MQTLLLTWWTGYIGSHNAVLFLEQGYNVIIIDNLSNSEENVIEKVQKIVTLSQTERSLKFYKWDLRNTSDIEIVFSENTIDTVIHFAGAKAVGESCEKPFMYYDNNLVGTINLCKVMERYDVRNIIFSSSATVYNPLETPPFSEVTPTGNTTNPYGTTKLLIENILRDLATHKWFNVINLRYFNPVWAHKSGLIGEDPNDIPNNLLPYIMKVANGELKKVSVFGDDYDTPDGTGVRDYIHVVDLAEGHLAALKYMSSRWKNIVSWCSEKLSESQSPIGWVFWGISGDNILESNSSIYQEINLWTGNGTSVMEMIQITGDIASAYCSPKKAKEILWWEAKKTVKQAITDSWNFIQHNK